MNKKEIETKIFELIKEYFAIEPEKQENEKIGVGFPCYDHNEVISATESLLNLNLSQGKKVAKFEEDFRNYIGTKYSSAVNSGSSANLLAIDALIKCGHLKKGDEVIVPSATFTTVISPIIQHGLVPVFVDIEKDSYNIDPEKIKNAISEKTGLIMVVHSLGCPANMSKIGEISKETNIPILEDCCEAHGAAIDGKKVGSFGLISTFSFFVAHNITTGEGGMILTNDSELNSKLVSIREFGRLKDFDPEKARFYYDDGILKDFDERYVFKEVGYNVRMSDIHAALGIEQVKKLDNLNEIRVKITDEFTQGLNKYNQYLKTPYTPENGFHSFYGYTLLVKDNPLFNRQDIVRFLDDHNIETRAFMGGDLSIQPAYRNETTKTADSLEVTKDIANNAFFIGCHQNITEEKVKYILDVFDKFFKSINNGN